MSYPLRQTPARFTIAALLFAVVTYCIRLL